MGKMGSSAGRRRAPSSPNPSTHTSPSLPPTTVPRLKLSLRNTPSAKPQQSKSYTRQTHHANTASASRRAMLTDSDSDLTPAEDETDSEGLDEEANLSSRMKLNAKAKGAEHTPTNKKTGSAKKAVASSAKAKDAKPGKLEQTSKVTTAGPGGRDRKRALKVGEMERRRARDEKFDINAGDGYMTPSRTRRSPPELVASDSESSYGDDESDHNSLIPPFQAFEQPNFGFGHETNDVDMENLPTAFAGQEIEDLAYGGGKPEFEMERQVLSGLWEDDEDEDEELFISHLSGSEADRGSESSMHESDSDESSSEGSSTSDDEVDEFGFPRPTMAPPTEEGPLVLMENWDGQFVLVQPRQERSRSRRRGSRGSRTNGSVSGSTILSGTDQANLIIDADAEYPSSSEWSGMSDEENGGDTTDSMAEEDMPMLDSPALDMIIEEQMAGILGATPNGMNNGVSTGFPPVPPSPAQANGPPSIVITDPTGTPSLSNPDVEAASETAVPPVVNGSNGVPQTPGPLPQMGTFHSTCDDPAQHAVIDGSKIPTKSPFTHGRRSRRGRADSVSTTNTERKRKSSTTAAIATPFVDPFFPSTLPKRARYSSIPGHPRYVAAKRQQERERLALLEGDEETSDEAEMDLEDMLETGIMGHDSNTSHHGHSGGFRFDRVPVSTYLRRNFGGAGTRREDVETFSSPVQARSYMAFGMGMDLSQYSAMNGVGLGMGIAGADGWGLDDTLAGPPQRMMLISPNLPALGEDGERALSRKERRRRKRIGAAVSSGLEMPSATVPPLQI